MAKTVNGITKIEGVRRAVQELGQEATTEAIQGFLKDRFGIEMSKQHLYVAKGQVLREAIGKTTPSKPAATKDETTSQPTQEAGSSKARRSRKRAKSRSGKASKPQASKATIRFQVQSANGSSDKGSVALEDVRTIKGLVDRFGAKKVRSLIDLFAK